MSTNPIGTPEVSGVIWPSPPSDQKALAIYGLSVSLRSLIVMNNQYVEENPGVLRKIDETHAEILRLARKL